MLSESVATVVKMMESLSETAQERVVEHLREYIEELQDEIEWDSLFKKTQPQLIAVAKRARQEIAKRKGKTAGYQPVMNSATLPSFGNAYKSLNKQPTKF